MIRSLFGTASQAGRLKADMDQSTVEMRRVAHRIANATTPGGGEFGQVLNQQLAEQQAADLETEMVSLADTQLRFEAATKLLQKTYAQLRTSFRNH